MKLVTALCAFSLFVVSAVLGGCSPAVSGEASPGARDAVFFGDDAKVLCTVRHDQNQHVWIMDTVGTSHRQITFGARVDSSPSISPDLKKIVFVSNAQEEGAGLHIINVDGTDLRVLDSGMGNYGHPLFSPDGKEVVFSGRLVEDRSDIYAINIDGTGLKQLTTGPAHDVFPFFVKNGRAVVFMRVLRYSHSSPIATPDWHDWDMYEVSMVDYKVTRLTHEEWYVNDGFVKSPIEDVFLIDYYSWGLDKLEFLMLDINESDQFEAIAPIGAGLRERYPESRNLMSQMRDPAFSIDGKNILFTLAPNVLQKNYIKEIYEVSIGDLKARRITNFEKMILEPRYSADGKKIVYRVDSKPFRSGKTYELWVINTDGTSAKRIQLPKSL